MDPFLSQLISAFTAVLLTLAVLSYNNQRRGNTVDDQPKSKTSILISHPNDQSCDNSDDIEPSGHPTNNTMIDHKSSEKSTSRVVAAPLTFHKPLYNPHQHEHRSPTLSRHFSFGESTYNDDSDSDYDDGYVNLIDNFHNTRSSLYLPTPGPKGVSPRSSSSLPQSFSQDQSSSSPIHSATQSHHSSHAGTVIDPQDLKRLSTVQIEVLPPFRSSGAPSPSYLKQSRQFMEMSVLLPHVDHPEYSIRRTWLHHLITHKFAIEPDFFSRLGHVAHLIDVRSADQLIGPIGYIPGANWYPIDNAHRIVQHFPKDSLIAVVCNTDSESRKVVKILRSDGFVFAAVLNGGMKQWKVMGLSATRDPSILNRAYQPTSVIQQYQHQYHTNQSIETQSVVVDQDGKPVNHMVVPHSPTASSESSASHYHQHSHQQQQPPSQQQQQHKKKKMTLERLTHHIGYGGIQWLKISAFMVHGRLSCVDGRDNNAVIGTPGGDMGEFILLLTVTEQLLHSEFSYNDVSILFQRRLDDFGRFYMHTDQACLSRLIDMLDFPLSIKQKIQNAASHFAIELFLLYLPVSQRETIIDMLIDEAYIGCGHLKFLLLNSSQYKVRKQLVRDSLRCFFTARFAGAQECEFVVLPGLHQECGVANITLDEHVHSFTKIPLLPPTIQGQQIFVNHPQVTSYLRVELCEWLLTQTDIIKFTKLSGAALRPLADLLAQHHLDLTVTTLAKDLPLFTLKFDHQGSCEVVSHGLINVDDDPASLAPPPPIPTPVKIVLEHPPVSVEIPLTHATTTSTPSSPFKPHTIAPSVSTTADTLPPECSHILLSEIHDFHEEYEHEYDSDHDTSPHQMQCHPIAPHEAVSNDDIIPAID